jgi:hypothetical protein
VLFKNLFADEYAVATAELPKGVYIKEMRLGGRDVMGESLDLRLGAASTPLEVTLASDGGGFDLTATDSDGAPIPDATVVVVPSDAADARSVAAKVLIGRADQRGVWMSATLMPGKYRVFGTTAVMNESPQSIEKILRPPAEVQEVEVKSGVRTQVVVKVRDEKK